MSLKIQFLSPNLKFQWHPLICNRTRTRIGKPGSKPSTIQRISCSNEKENLTDEMLAAELGLQLKRLNSEVVQREEALKKSRALLFAEICDFMGLKSEDLKKKWRRLDEEEKWSLVKGFVAEWSAHFHPLSVRSAKELVEEYVALTHEFPDSVSPNFFSDFTKFLGFSQE